MSSAFNRSDDPPNFGVLLFWGLFVVCWLATLGQRALLHPDEGRYAELSLGMLLSGDWVTPRLNGILYFEKPALQYWAGAISFFVFGINEFAARFWPALTGLLSILAVGLTGRRLWGAGQFTALVMGGTLWFAANSHFLNLDTGLTFFLTLALCGFLWSMQDDATAREQRYGLWIAWAAMAGATLSKGLIGVLIPAGALAFYIMTQADWRLLRKLRWFSGMTLFFALCAPWFILVSARNPEFAHFFFIHEHVERFLTHQHGREEPFWYFLPVLLVGFLPWTTLLPRLTLENARRTPGERFQAGRFLLCWALFVLLFFSVSGSKLPSYILPMFPALALLGGRTLATARAASLKKHLVLPLLAWGAASTAYLFVGTLPDDPGTPAEAYRELSLYLSCAGLAFLVGGAMAWRALNSGRTQPGVMWLTAASLAALLLCNTGHDAIGRLKSSKALVEAIGPSLPADAEIYSIRMYDQTFPFYLKRPVIQVEYHDEFTFGQRVEPEKAIPSLGEFVVRWRSAGHALAMMDEDTYNELSRQGVAMKTVYQDVRRRVVAKP